MSLKKMLAALLILAILLMNGACIPAWADEIVTEEAAGELSTEPAPVQEAAEQPAAPVEAAPEEQPVPAPEPEPEAPAPEPQTEAEPAQPAESGSEPVAAEPEPEKPAASDPEPEQSKETKDEAPAEQSEQPKEDKPEEAPAQDAAPDKGEESVHNDETPAPADPGSEPTADAGSDPEPSGQDAAPAEDPATEAPQDPTAEPAAQEKATEAPAQPAEITGLAANKDIVVMGESAGFSFTVKNAVRLRYRLDGPGGADSGALSPDAGSYSFTASRDGRYTFELTATGASGAEVSASASLTSIDAPALTLSVKPNVPSCHGGDPVSFTLSVTEGLELKSASVKAALGGKVFYESAEFTKNLTVDVPAKGKVSEVSVTASVTDIYGRTAEKSAAIPCAVHAEETRAQWEATMKGVKKTGVWPEDLVAIAKSQIGYTESSKDFGPKYDGGISGYTRYGDWAGMPYEEWCAMFACFCLHYAGIEEENFPYAANCQRWINRLKKVDLYAPRASYTPKVGDLAFFDWQLDNDSDHVGIIFELDYDDDGEVKGVRTIEGNSKGYAVYDGKYYSINDSTMIGFGLVNRCYGHELEKQHRDLTFEGEGFTVNLGVEPEAKVPAFAELSVQEILPGDANYDSMLSELRSQLTEGDLGYARFLQVGFVDEDGSDVTVQAPLRVEVSFDEKMVGDKDFAPGVAAMGGPVEINADVTLDRKKNSCAFSFTQDVNEPLCLFATGTLTYKEGALKIKQNQQSAAVSFGEDALIPDGAVLSFYEVEPDTEAYDACVAMMGSAMPRDEAVTTRFFTAEVSFNGMPIRPAVPVSVTLDGNQKGASAELVRVKDGAELVCQTTPRKGGKLVIDFNADRFGTFAVEYSAE